MSPLIPAAIQVDVDNVWTHLSDLGIQDFSRPQIIYQESIARFLELFRMLDIKATFFCIGNDAVQRSIAPVIEEMANEGHEVANHSLSHPQNFSSLSYENLKKEIMEADSILRESARCSIYGFKSPGWSTNRHMLSVLSELNYQYDSSVMPSFLLPVLSLARYILSRGIRTNKKYGSSRLALTPLKPYSLGQSVIEIPNSTLPIVRMPFHSTFVYLLGKKYFRVGEWMLRRRNLPLVYVFHAIDLLPQNVDSRLSCFPAMRRSLRERYEIVRYILEVIQTDFQLMTSRQLANHYSTK